MAYYYRKPINKTVDNVKLKMQIGALTVEITETINKINNLLEVDKDIKKDITDNSNSFKFEGKRKDTSLVITRSFQYFFEHRHQL